MEDDLKNEKVEYLINHWSDLIQIWILGLGHKACYGNLIWRQPSLEDDLQNEK